VLLLTFTDHVINMLRFRFTDRLIGEIARAEVRMPTTTRTPAMRGLPVSWDLLTNGLRVDGPMVQGMQDNDLARVRMGRRRVYVLGHPDYVDHVLHDGADRYHKSLEYELLRTVTGLNLFTDEDESWRRHRMMLNPTMAKRHVVGMVDLMVGPVADLVAQLEAEPDDAEIEMSGAMVALTLDVVGAALFGHRFGDVARRMKAAVTAGLRGAEVATRLLMLFGPPVWTVRAFSSFVHRAPLLPPKLAQLQWVMRSVDEEVWGLIRERQANPTDSDDLLNLLLHASDDEGALPIERVRDEVTTFMLAGHETTANAMAWSWYLLALHPEARERMLAEVDEVLVSERPTVAELERLVWTRACVMEAMRLYPPAWVVPRVAIADDEIAGHRIPKRSTVLMPIHALHRDERFWEDPDSYDPTRFLPENSKGRHRSAYLPFGGGRRICIGMSFALLEMALITSMLSRRFVFDLVPGHPVEPEATLTLRPRHGVRMIASRRAPERAAVAA
jgi:cytochrome P450